MLCAYMYINHESMYMYVQCTTQVVVDSSPQLTDSEQNVLRVGSRVWLKDKDLYGFVRYMYICSCNCTYMYMYLCSPAAVISSVHVLNKHICSLYDRASFTTP